jgi:hypothetical protein
VIRTLPEPSQEELDSRWGYIYLLVNEVNNSKYIGMHHQKPFENWRHYMGSGTLLRREQERFGLDNFRKELIEWVRNEEHAIAREELHIMRLSKEPGVVFLNEKLPERSQFPYGPPSCWQFICVLCELPSVDGYSDQEQRLHWCDYCANGFTMSELSSWLDERKRPLFLPEVVELGEVLQRFPKVRRKLSGMTPEVVKVVLEAQVLPRLAERAVEAANTEFTKFPNYSDIAS